MKFRDPQFHKKKCTQRKTFFVFFAWTFGLNYARGMVYFSREKNSSRLIRVEKDGLGTEKEYLLVNEVELIVRRKIQVPRSDVGRTTAEYPVGK